MGEKERASCRLQVLLAPEARTPDARRAVGHDLEGLGFEITGSGAASLSARLTAERFEQLFGGAALREAADALPLPETLRGRVTSITLAPPHLYLE